MRTLLLPLGVALAITAAACGGGNGVTGPSGSSQGLVGTWQASKAEFVHAANSSVRVDIVAQGSTLTLVLAASTYTLTIKDPGQAGQVTNGTWTSSRDTITLRESGMPFSVEFDMAQSGNNLTLTGGSVEFDFNADGANEQAKLNLALVRQ